MCSRGRDAVSVGDVPCFDFRKGPSFSSSLLEHIYRSIDADTNVNSQCHIGTAKLLDKRTRPVAAAGADAFCVIDKKLEYIDNDPLFFSNGSNSSDSNSSLFSDHDPVPLVLPTTKTRALCFLPPKPIRTREKKSKSSGGEKTEHPHCSETEQDDDILSSTKSRALKLYSHLKKMKQPISPGVKLTAFINSIRTGSNSKQNSNRGASTSAAVNVKPTTPSFIRTNVNSVKPSLVKQAPVDVKIVKTDVGQPSKREQHEHENSKLTTKISVERVLEEDGGSDCSDDLFELDHLKLSSIGVNGGDLPVMETTRISSSSNRKHKNRV